MIFILLAVLGRGTSALIVWRLYEASTRGVMHLRGGSYTRRGNPFQFWASYVVVAIALLLCAGLALIASAVLLGVFQ